MKYTPILATLLAALTLAGGAAFAQETREIKIATAKIFSSVDTVSDIQGVAHDTDPVLINPWGLAPGPEGCVHVADNGTGLATLYTPGGALVSGTALIDPEPHAIIIPPAPYTSGTVGFPTGLVVNDWAIQTLAPNDFAIGNVKPKSSHYLFATQDGAIVGFRKDVNASTGIIAVSNSNAGYTGLALSWALVSTGTAVTSGTFEHFLYAANFRQGTVDVYDNTFTPVTLNGSFTDPNPPAAPANAAWSPFNIKHLDFVAIDSDGNQALFHWILVAYAAHTAANPMVDVPETSGTGNGFVDLFTSEGAFVTRFVDATGVLSSPWGIAIAHTSALNDGAPISILVGNHGNGQINVFPFVPAVQLSSTPGPVTSAGALTNNQGIPLAFDGLWALHFGPKKYSKLQFNAYLRNPCDLVEDPSNLYFSAGLLDGTHGLVGKITTPLIP